MPLQARWHISTVMWHSLQGDCLGRSAMACAHVLCMLAQFLTLNPRVPNWILCHKVIQRYLNATGMNNPDGSLYPMRPQGTHLNHTQIVNTAVLLRKLWPQAFDPGMRPHPTAQVQKGPRATLMWAPLCIAGTPVATVRPVLHLQLGDHTTE
jgi:hypothetical protein